MVRSATEIEALRSRLSSAVNAMDLVELRYAELVTDIIGRTRMMRGATHAAVIEASVAKLVATK